MLQITPRERMTLNLLAEGAPTPDIATSIGLKPAEIASYMTALFMKMGVSSSEEAIASAARRGLLSVDARS